MVHRLFNRTQVVHCNGFSSEVVPISCDVPQGSIIGPFLFLLQFNNVHKVLKHSQIITYADDTVRGGSRQNHDIRTFLTIEPHLMTTLTNVMSVKLNWLQYIQGGIQ